MTNPTTPYISSYAAQIYSTYASALDQNIVKVKSQFTVAGAYGSSRMYLSIGEAITSSESAYFSDLLGAVKYYQSIYDITIAETYAVYKTYKDNFLAYTNSLGASASQYASNVTTIYSNQLPSLIALTTPWVTITSSKNSLLNGDVANIYFHLSEASTTFDVSDVATTGALSNQRKAFI
jgi:hypothetical protein